ncbi:hypothetical protein [Carboxylicivirga marina]|uniref:hypothetical protein n=1 Tax=Carboxylicivirga marina TaxID=2800988 RepID=UPI002598942A|nr:hypothetical protein [uncultured Carboxylicivirga sp.]
MKIFLKLVLIGLIGLIGCINNQTSKKVEKQKSESDLKTKNQSPIIKDPILGERIDGPANLRDTVKGKVILSIEDNQLVQCSEITNNWYQIGIVVPISKEQYDSYIIKKGEKITQNGVVICTAIDDIEMWMTNENNGQDTTVKYVGVIGGYTYKNNIKPKSIPEKELEAILNSGVDLTKANFKWYFKNFQFIEHGLPIEGYENTEQFMIYGAWIDDPSPIDRIRLIFDSNQLIAIAHERELKMTGKKSYDLVRNLELLVIKDFNKQELSDFIVKNQTSYRGVD